MLYKEEFYLLFSLWDNGYILMHFSVSINVSLHVILFIAPVAPICQEGTFKLTSVCFAMISFVFQCSQLSITNRPQFTMYFPGSNPESVIFLEWSQWDYTSLFKSLHAISPHSNHNFIFYSPPFPTTSYLLQKGALCLWEKDIRGREGE